MNDEDTRKFAIETFKKALNEHGYGFQYSVLHKAEEIFNKPPNPSLWSLEATEFPVSVQGPGTRIDFILKHTTNRPFYLLAECKRANPAYATWCFAHAPYVLRNKTTEYYILEQTKFYFPGTGNSSHSQGQRKGVATESYHIAVEARKKQGSDAKGNELITAGIGDTIEKAATQISRGLSGIVEFLSQHQGVVGSQTTEFLPVIFTTAEIWTTDVDLRLTDLESGNIDFSKSNFKQEPWIAYQYHLSPDIKHGYRPDHYTLNTFGGILESDYIRTIMVVSSTKVEEFLRWSSNYWT